jgi:hypothetical protein
MASVVKQTKYSYVRIASATSIGFERKGDWSWQLSSGMGRHRCPKRAAERDRTKAGGGERGMGMLSQAEFEKEERGLVLQ